MGKIQIITPKQKKLLLGLSQSKLRKSFYFTGGTVLSAYYLQHRYSDDLDFFSEGEVDFDSTLAFMEKMAKSELFTFTMQKKVVVQMFFLTYKDGSSFKVDFAYYPYRRIQKGRNEGNVSIDSLLDIGVNKTVAVLQRSDVKDFVDYYYLEQKFGLWDLTQGARVKFNMELDPILFASDLLKVEDFTFMPKMIAPLTLATLKNFFRSRAKEVGKRALV